MRWYADLYLGDKASEKSYRIIKKIEKHRFQKNVYVITDASNGTDLFDIYPARVLLQPYFRKKDFLIIGIAIGYDEAVALVCRIVKELYLEKGITNLREYLKTEGR